MVISGKLNIPRSDEFDSTNVYLGGVTMFPFQDADQDGELLRRVLPTDIKARIGFRIPQLLSLSQSNLESFANFRHPGKDEVGCAVENSVKRVDTVGDNPLTQDFYDGNRPSNASLV